MEIRMQRRLSAGQAYAFQAAFDHLIQKAQRLFPGEGTAVHAVVRRVEAMQAVVIADVGDVPVDVFDIIIVVFGDLTRKQ